MTGEGLAGRKLLVLTDEGGARGLDDCCTGAMLCTPVPDVEDGTPVSALGSEEVAGKAEFDNESPVGLGDGGD